MYSSVIGLLLVSVIYNNFGYEIYSLALFVALFIPIAFKLNAREGIAVNVMLASHLLERNNIVLNHLMNEFSIVILGAIIALAMNLHMPNKKIKLICARDNIEEKIKLILVSMSYDVRNLCTVSEGDLSLDHLEKDIKNAKKLSYEYMNNYLLKDNRYFIEYFQMRLQQVRRLRYMKERLDQVLMKQDDAVKLSEFTERLARELDELNDGRKLLADVKDLKEDFKSSELPDTKEEFVEWSALFQYINDLEEFIHIKIRFFEKQIIFQKS